MKGYLFFSKDKSFMSKAIRWFEKHFSGVDLPDDKRYSHTGFFYDDDLVFEAKFINKFSIWQKEYIDDLNVTYEKWQIVNISQATIQNAIKKTIYNYEGNIYAIWQLLWIGIKALLSIFKKSPKFTWTKNQICGELVWLFLNEIPEIKPLISHLNKDDLFLSQLLDVFIKHPEYFKGI